MNIISSFVTLKDVSKKAGVSVSAVSKALKDSPEIGEETKARIISIANEMNYHPNTSARSLRLGKTNRIGVILPNNSYSYNQVLNGISEVALQNDFVVVTVSIADDPQREKKAIDGLISMPVDGILAVPIHLDNYDHVSVPVVFMSRYPYRDSDSFFSRRINDSFVITDDYSGQRLATRELIRTCGEKLFILLGSDDTDSVAGMKESIRLNGYKDELNASGIPFDAGRVERRIITLEDGYKAASMICKKAEPPFGICVTNDFVAIGVIRAAVENGLRIPEDVKIVGFDDFDFSGSLNPPLTTIHCSRFSLGSYATQNIISQIRSHLGSRAVHTILQPQLIKRQSS